MSLEFEAPRRRRSRAGLELLWLTAASLAAACAQGPGTQYFDEAESGVEFQIPSNMDTPDAGMVVVSQDPPAMIPDIPMGNPAARPDAGLGAVDAGGGIKPVDAGSGAPHDAAAPIDSSTPKPPDAAVAADTGTPHPPDATTPSGQTCSTTPAYATPDACSKCICAKCSSQIAACYASSTASLCGPVQECAQSNHCTGEACYCANDIALICALGPSGPCIDAIQSAAGPGSGPIEVQTARDTAGTPLALANDTGTCSANNCKSECGL
jgi:hypothetical protein